MPGDRHRFGLVLSFPLTDNLVLNDYYHAPYSQRGWSATRTPSSATRRTRSPATTSAPRPPTVAASTLSGGNQQKIIVAREFEGDLKLLVLDQPTRGLDVGSIEFIHRQAIARRDSGVGILLVSAELDEVLELSDRIAVMYRGAIVEVLDGRTADREKVGLLMATGGRAAERQRSRVMTARADAIPGEDPILVLVPCAGHRAGARSWARSFMILSSPLVDGSINLLLPVEAYVALFRGAFGSLDAIVNTLKNATPLILAGFAVGIGFKAGPVQHRCLGPVPGRRPGRHAVGPGPGRRVAAGRHPAVDLLAGMVGGLLWGMIPGILKAFSGAHEVVTTIMLNYVAIFLVSGVIGGPLRGEDVTYSTAPMTSTPPSCPSSWATPATWGSCSRPPRSPSCGGSCTGRSSASRSAPPAPTAKRPATPG